MKFTQFPPNFKESPPPPPPPACGGAGGAGGRRAAGPGADPVPAGEFVEGDGIPKPETRENTTRRAKREKRGKSENGGKSLNLIKSTKFSIFTPESPKLPSKKVVQNHGFQVSGEFLDF